MREGKNGRILSLGCGGQHGRLVWDRRRTDRRWLGTREGAHEGLGAVEKLNKAGNSKVGGEEVGSG